ncbi:MAG: DeoR family transcriptional regulator, partial [Planctomycetota bacterium]|nr:DeoR family transcriptional regulator [Planctomycetota bacterium]
DTGAETPRRDVVPMPLEVPEPIDAIPPDSGSVGPSVADDDSAPIDAIAPKELQGRLRLAFNLIRQRGSLSTPEYVQLAGVSPRTGLRDMNDLVATGLIRRTGKRRGARYRLDEPAKL